MAMTQTENYFRLPSYDQLYAVGMVVLNYTMALFAGTAAVAIRVLCKMAYDTKAIGLSGRRKLFLKPMFLLLLLFGGMAPCLPIWIYQQYRRPKEERTTVSLQTMLLLIIPSTCELVCDLFLLLGLLFIAASTYQMMRNSVIIFTVVLKHFFARKKFKFHMWGGVLVIAVSVLVVASTSLFSNPAPSSLSTSDKPVFGMILVLFGCFAQGVQFICEEKVMAVDSVPALVVIGAEGLWGILLTLLVVFPTAYLLPGLDNGHFEDPVDSVAMLMHSTMLQVICLLFIVLGVAYNFLSVYISKHLNAAVFVVLDSLKPITIWICDLLLFYVILPGAGFGEMWMTASYLQLGGLMVLYVGTALFNGSLVTVDTHEYQPIDNQVAVALEAEMVSSAYVARSPLIIKPLATENAYQKFRTNRWNRSTTV